jgi:hypothetical protein
MGWENVSIAYTEGFNLVLGGGKFSRQVHVVSIKYNRDVGVVLPDSLGKPAWLVMNVNHVDAVLFDASDLILEPFTCIVHVVERKPWCVVDKGSVSHFALHEIAGC